MVVDKDSSILGYPGETSKPLHADHHGVCKYDSPQDPNYIAVRNVLKFLIRKITSTSRPNQQSTSDRIEWPDLKLLLAITEPPDIDYIHFRDQWVEGTNEWILEEKNYLNWVNASEETTRILWLNGRAGTGKSVLSSFIINSLLEQGACCQYFFIRFGDQKKRTLSFILRSVAYQLAQSVHDFSEKVAKLAEEGIDFENVNPRIIWECIFKSILFRMEIQKPIYWIIDGLDEAAEPREVVKLLSNISSASIPIRILLASRKTSDIEVAFKKIPQTVNSDSISIEGHVEDPRRYIHQELDMPGTDQFRDDVLRRIIERSQSNLLVRIQHLIFAR